jgi:membrane protease YdiL (CAAX protease family)
MAHTNQQTSAITAGKENYLIGSPTSTFSISQLRVRIGPILAIIGLGFLVLIPGAFANGWVRHILGLERGMAMPWLAHYVDHAVMLVISLVLIAWLCKGHFSEYGLQRPKGKSYVLAAIAWGTFFGILMTVVDYFPQILARIPPPDNLPLSAASMAGWLGFEFIFVGFCEEIPFRGLLQTFLMRRTSGRIRLGKFDMHIAGVILAMLFALAHITNFWQRPFWFALAQQIYALALGILYAYWREKSGSLLASIIGHNFSDGVEYALMFLMTWLWR